MAAGLKRRRAELRQTQRDAATVMGVAQTNLSRWENGILPEATFYETLMQYLDLDAAGLATRILYGQLDRADLLRTFRDGQ